MKRANIYLGVLLLALSCAGEVMAAICTTNAGAGTWNTAGTWSCGHVPLAADTVVISRNITLDANRTVAGLTINAGVVLNDNGNDLTVTGNVINNGTYGVSGGGGRLFMTGAGATISGNGTFTDSRLYIDANNITLPAGSTMNFTLGAQIRVGNNAAGSFTIAGAITDTGATAGNRILRVYNASTVTISGTLNVPNSYVQIRAGGSVVNNGTVVMRYLDGNNAATATWTQGVNSNLTMTMPAVSWVGTFSAAANGNTVTYNGTSTVIPPSAGYWNLAGTIFPGACPVAYPINGTSPCPAGGPVSVTLNPSNCVNVAGIGTQVWGTPAFAVSSNNAYATLSLNDFQVSNYLRCTGYGFAIPVGATINGITVRVERRASNTNSIRDAAMRLVMDAAGLPSIQATDRSTLTNYTVADAIEAHGGTADLWGGAWTAADINSVNFGAAFASQKPGAAGGGRTVSVDHMPITVTYTTSTLHHVAINAPAAAMSLTAVPVTIAPHSSAHAALTAAGTINLSTSTGTGDWTIGSGTGTLTPGAANSGLATYMFGAAESSATLAFTSQAAGTVTLNVADSGGADMLLNTPVAEKANTITFSGASFVFTGSACTDGVAFGTAGQCAGVVWSPRIAGQALASIYITSVNTAGVPTRLHPTQVRTRNMQFGLSCHDPIANAGVQAAFSATGVALPLCQANGATPATWTAAATLSFPGGSPSVGPYSFNYADVGKVELWMRNSAATTELGSSGAFVVKPAGFTLSSIKRTSDNFANPAAANAAGTAFVKAGDAFTVTVTAVNSAAAATPNYGKETMPESVKLTPALVGGLGLTNNPVMAGTFGAFANGIATGAAFAWDEVGIITLTPSVLDADYLGAGDTTGTTTGNVGRFYAHHFVVTPGATPIENRADLCNGGVLVSDGVTPCAPTFTYMGEQMDANFTLTAQSLNNITTQNYAGAFAKLDPSAAANPLVFGAVDVTVPAYLTGRLDTSLPASGSFLGGSAAIIAPLAIARCTAITCPANTNPNREDGPYAALALGIAPMDSDGVVMGAFDLDTDATAGNDHALIGATEMRYGRMKLANAHGSELLPLPIVASVQYWNGTSYQTSIADSETQFDTRLSTAGGNVLTAIVKGPLALANVNAVSPGLATFANGVNAIKLAPPNVTGSVDLSIVTAPVYLLPSTIGRATFGVYKGANQFIYQRENY